MTLALKRVQPDDYDVIHDGEIIGRIYRMIGIEEFGVEELWRWRLPGSRAPTEGRAAASARWSALTLLRAA